MSLQIIPADDPKQARRMRRFLMAAAASLLIAVLVGAASILGLISRSVMINTNAAIIILLAAFFLVFRSGVNRRFADPSLTLPQIVSATAVILYLLYASPEARGIFTLAYTVVFFFGVFRLRTRQLLMVTVSVIAAYALIVLSEWKAGLTDVALRREILRWLVLSTVLAYLSVMAGYVARLRRQAGENRTQLINAMQKVRHLAAHDELTGVPNRRSVDSAVAAEQERAERYDSTFSICVMDLDFFKRVNDSFGHAAGDTVLKIFVQSVHESLRPTDLIGRYGGEEFVLLLPHTPLAGAVSVAERIRVRCSELRFGDVLKDLTMTVSIGVAEHLKGQGWERTIERADQALYRAKQDGRNQVRTAS